MGFYVSFSKSFPVCKETGKPFYYGKNFTKIYDLSTVEEVPIKFRRFLDEQGNKHFPLYMRDDHYIDLAEHVLDSFPSWPNVEECLPEEAKPWWKEEDHNLFKEAMRWFALHSFVVHWG